MTRAHYEGCLDLSDRKREAVKRSVHFILPNDFVRSLKGLVRNYTRSFWEYLDNEQSAVQKRLRDAFWTVWVDDGVDVLSVNFTHGTSLVLDRGPNNVLLSLKETGGKLTKLKHVQLSEPVSDEVKQDADRTAFEQGWRSLLEHERTYPNYERPVTSCVAQVIAEKYDAPLPVVLKGIVVQTLPSLTSNGLLELHRKNMPNEVFPQDAFNAALNENEVERLDYWRFKVKKDKYQDWRMRTSLAQVKVPSSNLRS